MYHDTRRYLLLPSKTLKVFCSTTILPSTWRFLLWRHAIPPPLDDFYSLLVTISIRLPARNNSPSQWSSNRIVAARESPPSAGSTCLWRHSNSPSHNELYRVLTSSTGIWRHSNAPPLDSSTGLWWRFLQVFGGMASPPLGDFYRSFLVVQHFPLLTIRQAFGDHLYRSLAAWQSPLLSTISTGLWRHGNPPSHRFLQLFDDDFHRSLAQSISPSRRVYRTLVTISTGSWRPLWTIL